MKQQAITPPFDQHLL